MIISFENKKFSHGVWDRDSLGLAFGGEQHYYKYGRYVKLSYLIDLTTSNFRWMLCTNFKLAWPRKPRSSKKFGARVLKMASMGECCNIEQTELGGLGIELRSLLLCILIDFWMLMPGCRQTCN